MPKAVTTLLRFPRELFYKLITFIMEMYSWTELQEYFENSVWGNVYINKLLMMGRKEVANDNSLLML